MPFSDTTMLPLPGSPWRRNDFDDIFVIVQFPLFLRIIFTFKARALELKWGHQ